MKVRYQVTGRDRGEIEDAAKDVLMAFLGEVVTSFLSPTEANKIKYDIDVHPLLTRFGSDSPEIWLADVEVVL